MPRKKQTEDKKDGEIKSAPQLHVNDIAKPGETPPSPTSRPIITPRSGMIKQDPMMAGKPPANDDKSEEAKPSSSVTKTSELKLEPQNEISEPAEEKKEENDTQQAESETPDKDDEKAKEDSAAINTIADSAGSKKVSAKEAEEEKKKKDQIDQLVASRQYSIPIREGGHKASSQKFMSWLLLLLLLAAIGIYLAIDAGYLDAGITLPYDLIKN